VGFFSSKDYSCVDRIFNKIFVDGRCAAMTAQRLPYHPAQMRPKRAGVRIDGDKDVGTDDAARRNRHRIGHYAIEQPPSVQVQRLTMSGMTIDALTAFAIEPGWNQISRPVP
jgi:hypothetical protein